MKICPGCGLGCGMVTGIAGDRVIKVSGNKNHPGCVGRLCSKGNTCALALTESGRLAHACL